MVAGEGGGRAWYPRERRRPEGDPGTGVEPLGDWRWSDRAAACGGKGTGDVPSTAEPPLGVRALVPGADASGWVAAPGSANPLCDNCESP